MIVPQASPATRNQNDCLSVFCHFTFKLAGLCIARYRSQGYFDNNIFSVGAMAELT